ncbi:MAG TPA: hypothetical protein VMZ91_07685 [Candidatus Paceibacterota bacterium]|nr:hypothetical protein [Candidatus Paceibacterota bacterium]
MVKIIKNSSERTFYYNENILSQKPMVAVKRNRNSNKYYNFEYDFFGKTFSLKYEVVEKLRQEAKIFLKKINLTWDEKGYNKKHSFTTIFGNIEGLLSNLFLDDAIEFATKVEEIILNKKNWNYQKYNGLLEEENIIQKKTIEGKWFHTFNKDGLLEYQGQVLSFDSENKSIIAELYSFVDGNANGVKKIDLNETTIKYYDTDKEMREYREVIRQNEKTPSYKENIGVAVKGNNGDPDLNYMLTEKGDKLLNIGIEFEKSIKGEENKLSDLCGVELSLKKDHPNAYLFPENKKETDFFRKDWDSSKHETIQKIEKLEQDKIELQKLMNSKQYFGQYANGNSIYTYDYKKIKKINKEISLLQELLPTNIEINSNYKTLDKIIIESANEEKQIISKYLVEKFAQAVIEGVQDFFKENFNPQKEQTQEIQEWIKDSLIRSREYQRWSEHEIHSLIYLWKIQCKNPADIGRLMQRSVGSIEKMIDFIESDKYLNSENFYKEIKTKEEDKP